MSASAPGRGGRAARLHVAHYRAAGGVQLRFRADFPVPVVRLWRSVSRPAEISSWFEPVVSVPGRQPAEWCVTFDDDDGEHRKTARLVSCEPGQGYTVEWVDRPYPTSVLCVTLHRGNGGSRLRLRHHGVPEELVRGYRVGWPGYLGRLRHRLAGD